MALKTPNDGAAQERAAIKRHIVRLQKQVGVHGNSALLMVATFIDTRAARASKKAGGLGHKTKAK